MHILTSSTAASKMGPRSLKPGGRPPVRARKVIPSSSSDPPQPEPLAEPNPEIEPSNQHAEASNPPLHTNGNLYNTLQALSARLTDIQSCRCPADCRGPDSVHTPPVPSQEDPETPQRPPRCREVLKRSSPRHRATVTAEAEASMEIQLPRLGDTATGTLRMSVTVHTCPANLASRRGVRQSFNFLALMSVFIGGPFRGHSGAEVAGVLATKQATSLTIISSPRITEQLT